MVCGPCSHLPDLASKASQNLVPLHLGFVPVMLPAKLPPSSLLIPITLPWVLECPFQLV